MKWLLTLALPCLHLMAQAQTKIIAHKSHSGTTEDFQLAYEHNLFDIENSDFGIVIEPTVRTASLDSVIYISDSVAIMVTSEYCKKGRTDVKGVTRNGKWWAGRQTVYHHPLFSHQHALDSIKKVLKGQYYFQNNIDSTRFIGFDNEVPQPPVEENVVDPTVAAIPLLLNMDQDGNNGTPPLLYPAILMFSLLSAILVWQASKTVRLKTIRSES